MKKFFLVLLLGITMALTGCGSTATDDGGEDNPTDQKNPTGSTDPVDSTDPTDPEDDFDPTLPGALAGLFSDEITVGQAISGTLSGVEDEDGQGYKLEITTKATYHIVSMSGINLDALLLSSMGQPIAFGLDRSAEDLDFEIYIVLEPGVYILVVTSYEENAIGDYQVLVEEENVSHTSVIDANSSIYDILVLGEENVVEFEVEEAGIVQLYTTSTFDSYGKLYDSEGDLILEQDDNGNSFASDFYIEEYLEAGTYFIEVSELTNYGSGSYELTYVFPDSAIVYTPIALDSFIAVSDVEGKDRQYFSLTVTEEVTVDIYSSGDSDLEGEFYRTQNGMVPSVYNKDGGEGWNFLMEGLVLEPGTYYIIVIPEQYGVPYYEIHVDTK